MSMVESINLSPEDRSTTCSDMSRGPVPMECASPLTQLEQLFKVALTGMSGVGKSSLLQRLSNPDWKFQKVRATVGVDCRMRTMKVDDHLLKLQFTDTQGVERYARMTSSFYRYAHVILLVFDVNDMETFHDIRHALDEVTTYQRSPNVIKVLVGNKADALAGCAREVPAESAQEFAASEGIRYYETSAYDGSMLEELLADVCQQLKESHTGDVRKMPSMVATGSWPSTVPRGIQLDKKKPSKFSCLSC